ncbi:Uncharacterized protein QTN25_001839 [Entamoeba marina]
MNNSPQLTIPLTSPQQKQQEGEEEQQKQKQQEKQRQQQQPKEQQDDDDDKEPEWVAEAMKKKIPPTDVKTKYPGIYNISLNYHGKCSNVFKYPPNTNRDLIVFGYSKSQKQKASLSDYMYGFKMVVENIRKNAPNAKILMMVFGDIPELGIQQIFYETESGLEAANLRFVEIYKYLKTHETEFDRVISADFRDVFMYNDFFRTFSDNELIMSIECTSRCICVGQRSYLKDWLIKTTNETMANKFIEMNVPNINSGVIAGGIKHVMEFFKVWIENSEQSKLNVWGYEQSLINVLYYTGKMDHIPIVLETCTQRLCFLPGTTSNILNMAPDQKSITYDDGCSPVITHKGIPPSWESP